jgi:hypothetical protein
VLRQAVLVRRVGGSWFYGEACVFEKLDDLATVAKFASFVEAYVLVRNRLVETMLYEPAVQKVEWRGLGAKGFAVVGARVVVRNQAVAGLAVEANQTIETRWVGQGLLNHEAEINRDALIALSSVARVRSASIGLTELGLKADWALVEFSGNWELGDPSCVPMKIRNTTRVHVAKPLMPEDPKLIS